VVGIAGKTLAAAGILAMTACQESEAQLSRKREQLVFDVAQGLLLSDEVNKEI